jgi:hypothetical protein
VACQATVEGLMVFCTADGAFVTVALNCALCCQTALSSGLRLCSVCPHEHEMRPSYVPRVAPEFLIHKPHC